MSKKPITKVFTKIVGTTFDGRQALVAQARYSKIKVLRLVRDYENKYDPNAIAVYADMLDGTGQPEPVQLGYISNAVYVCNACGFLMDGRGRGAPKACAECGGDEFERMGLATELATAMDNGTDYKCSVTEFTGGGESNDSREEKNLGVNIFIEQLALTATV